MKKIFFLVLFFYSSLLIAQIPYSNEFRINTYTELSQKNSAIGMDRMGNSVIVWQSFDQYPDFSFDILAQRYDSLGTKIGPEFSVNSPTDENQQNPAIAVLDDGSFIVTWQSYLQEGDSSLGNGIYAQRFNSSSNPTGGLIHVNTTDSLEQINPDISADESGNFIIVWASNAEVDSFFYVYAQRFDFLGNKVGTEFRVDETNPNFFHGSERDPKIAVLSDGKFAITWSTFINETVRSDVYIKIYDANANVLLDETLVPTINDGSQIYPDIAASKSTGDFFVIWEDLFAGIGGDIFGQRYSVNGAKSGSEIQINETDIVKLDQMRPAVSMDMNGNIVAVWSCQGDEITGEGAGIFGQRFDNTNQKIDNQFTVNTNTLVGKDFPDVQVKEGGDFVVTWDSNSQDGSYVGVYGQVYKMGPAFTVFPEINFNENQSYRYHTSTYFPYVSDENNTDAQLTWQRTNGTFMTTVLSNDSITITPNLNFSGQDSFQVTATDPSGYNATAWQRVSINNVINEVPVITDQVALTMFEDSSLTITLDDLTVTDGDNIYPNGFTLTVKDSTNYTKVGNTITPTLNFSGNLVVPVYVNDGVDNSNQFNLSVTVTAVNDAPVVTDQNALTTAEETGLVLKLADLTVTDVDNIYPTGFNLVVKDSTNYTRVGSTITPVLNFNGNLSVPVVVYDGTDSSAVFVLTVAVTAKNDAPTVANAIADENVNEDAAYFLQFADTVFNDVDAGDVLTYSATLSDNSALPSWLSFTAGTRTFSGTPLNGDVGTITIKVTATDDSSASVSDEFDLTVANTNDAPTVANAIADQNAAQDKAFTFQFAANVFNDVDVGDNLAYTATLSDDSSLPTWLGFDGGTRTFSGTPTSADLGTIIVKVTAMDNSAAAVSDEFNLFVANTNDPPVLDNPISDQNATEDAAFSFQFAAGVFSDPDVGDNLTYSATLSDDSTLPAWLTFTAGTRTFEGTPLNEDIGTISIKVTATDDSSANVTDEFNLTVANTNDAPTVANAISDQNIAQSALFTYQFAADVFNDVDVGDSLRYTATLADDGSLPAWLSFTAGIRTFNGTPTNDDLGTISVKLTATDDSSATIFDTFDIVVSNVNDAPVVANLISDQNAKEDAAFSFQFAADVFSDPDVGDNLTYTATLSDDIALPSWLTFTAGTRTFDGTPLNADVATLTVKVTATDDSLASVSDEFVLTVANTNDVPTLDNPMADQNAKEDVPFNFQFAADVFGDVDVGDNLTFAATLTDDSALPTWLTFTSATRTFSGTPTSSDLGTISIKITATDDSSATITDEFNLTVANTNDAPIVANAMSDQNATEDQGFSFQFAANVFTDEDIGDSLRYAAMLSDDSLLPLWLTFTAVTRTFSGIPANADVGTITVKVTATDDSSASVFDEFDLVVANTNDAPIIAGIPDQTIAEGQQFAAIALDVYVNDVDNVPAEMSWNYTGNSQLSVNINPTTRVATVSTPNINWFGSESIIFTATDPGLLLDTDTVTFTVTSVNDAPTVANPIPNQGNVQDILFSFQFANDAFNDVDPGDNLAYTATLSDDSVLPAWLAFTPATRTFSGTPGNDDVGTFTVKVTATDDSSASVFDEFDITVVNANDGPFVMNPIGDQNAVEDAAFSFTFAADVFGDPDVGDTLIYSATLSDDSALPVWLIFTPATRTFSGTPTNDNVGAIAVKLTATDASSATATDEFNIFVANTNDTPTVANPIANQGASQDILFTFQFGVGVFNDVDAGDNLTYTATLSDNSILPAWLSFDAGTRTFSGTPGNDDVATITIKVTATDDSSANVFNEFNLVITNANDLPIVANPISDQNAKEDIAFSFTFDANVFSDADVDDSLRYTASRSDGSALPTWLTFTAATRTFNGTPLNSDVGTLPVKITATDNFSANISDEFNIVVANTNDAPTVANPIADQNATEDVVFSFAFAADVFNDQDVDDNLTYSATLSDNTLLPAWLTFTTETRSFSGTPLDENVGTITVKVTATDDSAATVFDEFDIVIGNSNDAPVVSGIPDQTILEGQNFTAIALDDYVTDVDNADNEMSWNYSGNTDLSININPTTRIATISVPNANWFGSEAIVFTAIDPGFLSDTDTTIFTVTNINDVPVINAQNGAISTPEETALEITVSHLVVTDIDNTYPTGFTLFVKDSTNYTREGNTITPVAEFNGDLIVPVYVNDGTDSSNVFNLTVNVTPINDVPVITAQVPLTTAEETTVTIVLADLTVTDNDNTYPTGFSLTVQDGNNYTHVSNAITPVTDFNGDLTVPVIVKDGTDDSEVFNLTVSVTGKEDAPVVASEIADQITLEDELFSFTIPLNAFTDADPGDSLRYSATTTDDASIPAWLTFDATSHTFTGTPENDDVGNFAVKVTVTDDSSMSVSDVFNIQVDNVNDAPVLAQIVDITFAEDDSLIIPVETWLAYVSDPDNQVTELKFTLKGGEQFNITPGDNSVKVKAAANYFGQQTLSLVVSDGELSDTSSFKVTVTPVNDAPVLVNLPETVTFRNDSTVQLTMSDFVDDIDSENLQWSFETNNDSLLTDYNASTKMLTLSALFFAGSVDLVCTVEDDSGASVQGTTHVTIDFPSSLDPWANLLPTKYELHQNFPNPFNPTTNIRFGLPVAGDLTIELYNIVGQKVATIFEGHKTAGYHLVSFDASDLSSGVYFYTMRSKKFAKVMKMILVK